MATDQSFIDFVADHVDADCALTSRNMFGEYVLYSKGKVVALACDGKLFIKPTAAGRAYIGEPVEAPPYPGAKPCFLIEENIDDADWLSELIRVTEAELPAPKPKAKKKPKKAATKAKP